MRVKLRKQGNSLGFVVPASVVQAIELKVGLEYELVVQGDSELHFVLARQQRRSRYTAAQLLKGIPEEPLRYEDVPDYLPVGRELDW
ncbi:Transcriptional regulator/antitoxin, MazE [Deinococcus saxicola]|uniref:AbrB/MazE/SpoVT family DNA-binding domain-containing protein n=1 Tax=Deinococcus saxicola TaxID=249406 RepID=UPI0039F13E19